MKAFRKDDWKAFRRLSELVRDLTSMKTHTVDNIMQEFPVSEEEAAAYVKKYWMD